MKWLRKLAAWYLQKDVQGCQVAFTDDEFVKGGWIFGKDWHITF